MSRIALLAAVVFAVTAFADDKKPSADEKAMMEAYMKLAQPNEHHKKLDTLAGDWTYQAKFWMAPEAPPMEMAGTTKYVWILDGRFLREEVKGPAQAGMPPFHGVGIMGYDNARKKYVGAWIDSMTTSLTHMSGDMDSSGKALTFHYEEFDVATGKMAKVKQVTKINGPDSHDVYFYKVEPNGKEMKTGEIKAVRAK
jgi:hypothetical protein